MTQPPAKRAKDDDIQHAADVKLLNATVTHINTRDAAGVRHDLDRTDIHAIAEIVRCSMKARP